MKKSIIICSIITALSLLTSCSVPKTMYEEYAGFLDYSAYMNEGIFLTESNSVNFEYEPLGSVSALVYSGEHVVSLTKQTEENEIYGKRTTTKSKTEWKRALPKDALEIAVSQAVSKGANGLINIKVEPADTQTRSGFLVTGMAIRRK